MTETTTPPLDLDAIEARISAATPAAWSATELAPNEHFNHPAYWVEAEYDEASGTTLKTVAECTWSMADAEFIGQARQDMPALVAEVKRLRARWESSQRGVSELLDRSENAEFQHEKAASQNAVLNAALDRLVAAAEDVLAEAEQAETDAVFSGAAEPKRGHGLKALREALNALPAVENAVSP